MEPFKEIGCCEVDLTEKLNSKRCPFTNADHISREAAIENAISQMRVSKSELCMRERLMNLPAADVRHVVLCRDCKHSEHWYADKSRCFLWHESGIDVFNDGFCNYGEKREEADD